MRILALDYGSARCGCALSDPTGTLATPIDPVLKPATRKGFARVLGVVREHGVKQVVVGLPLGLSGHDTDQTREVRDWTQRLREGLGHRVDVALYDERFTTAIAARSGSKTTSEDSRAAAVLLEDYLVHRARLAERA